MSAATWLPAAVAKEARALLPAWAACAAALAFGGLSGRPQLIGAAVFAYALGAVALGAHSMGHEYTHRTIGLLLSHPYGRRRLFLTKTGVLGAMLLALTAVAWTTLFDGLDPGRLPPGVAVSFLMPIVALSALFLAPLLTMACRNPLAAVVFTFTVPGVLLVGGEVLGIARYGLHGAAAVDRFREVFVVRGMFAVCGAAAVAGWFLFMRLEAIDGRGREFHMPRWQWAGAKTTGAAPARSRSAIWLLVKKELRLQQMTFVLVALYILVWASLSSVRRLFPELGELPLVPVLVVYLGLLWVVIGSFASAEERQLGTLEWQVLLPMAAWQQWAVKVGTAVALAVLLGVALPLLLARLDSSLDDLRMFKRWGGDIVLAVLAVMSGSLYLSSVSSSGMRAVVLALPVMLGLFLFVDQAGRLIAWAVSSLALVSFATTLRPLHALTPDAFTWLLVCVAVGWIALLQWFGFQNHRSAERSAARVWRQVGWIAAFVIVSIILFQALDIAAVAAWVR